MRTFISSFKLIVIDFTGFVFNENIDCYRIWSRIHGRNFTTSVKMINSVSLHMPLFASNKPAETIPRSVHLLFWWTIRPDPLDICRRQTKKEEKKIITEKSKKMSNWYLNRHDMVHFHRVYLHKMCVLKVLMLMMDYL